MKDLKKIKSILSRHTVKGLVFVDAGAKDALEYIKGLEDITSIHGFEPNTDEFEKLREKYKQNSFRDLKLNSTGLADAAGTASLHITNRASMSSLLASDIPNYQKHFGAFEDFKQWEQNIGLHKKTEIQLETLDAYFSKEDAAIDFLKIDTQGTELLILKGAEALMKQKKIAVIKLEVSTIPVYKDQVLFSDIDLYLRGLNYTLVDFITYRENYVPVLKKKSPSPHFSACGDAVYILNSDSDTKEQALKKSLLLIWLGYTSLALHYLKPLALDPAETNALLSLSDPSPSQTFKNFVKNMLPPFLFRFLKTRIRK